MMISKAVGMRQAAVLLVLVLITARTALALQEASLSPVGYNYVSNIVIDSVDYPLVVSSSVVLLFRASLISLCLNSSCGHRWTLAAVNS